jgi:hypothetical protein
MSSFDGDSEIILEGTYTSPTNNVFTFQVAGSENAYVLGFVKGFSITISNLISSYKYAGAIIMNQEEFNSFKTVLNKNEDWKFRDIEIPGRWRTSTNAGGKRSSCRRRHVRSKRRHVRSKRRHRRTKHN